jgi:hypothetical protein
MNKSSLKKKKKRRMRFKASFRIKTMYKANKIVKVLFIIKNSRELVGCKSI